MTKLSFTKVAERGGGVKTARQKNRGGNSRCGNGDPSRKSGTGAGNFELLMGGGTPRRDLGVEGQGADNIDDTIEQEEERRNSRISIHSNSERNEIPVR